MFHEENLQPSKTVIESVQLLRIFEIPDQQAQTQTRWKNTMEHQAQYILNQTTEILKAVLSTKNFPKLSQRKVEGSKMECTEGFKTELIVQKRTWFMTIVCDEFRKIFAFCFFETSCRSFSGFHKKSLICPFSTTSTYPSKGTCSVSVPGHWYGLMIFVLQGCNRIHKICTGGMFRTM